MRAWFIIILFGVIILCSGCEKGYISLKSKEKRLAENTWRIKSYVDLSLNECLNSPDSKISFEMNGDFFVIKNDSISYQSHWELDQEKEYLTIGSNTFKLNLVTGKLLSLRFGDVDIFYVPVD